MSASRRRERQPLPQAVPIAPLIDVVFLLLIFFMLVTKFLNPSIDLTLPKSSTAQVNNEKSAVVAIIDERYVQLDGEQLGWAELTPLLKERAEDIEIVRLRADGETPHRLVIRAFDHIRAAGLTEIAIEAEVPEEYAAGGAGG